MTTTDHSNCLHTRDSKGRAACRKAGGPSFFARKVQADAIASGEALCTSCFWNALDAADMNIRSERGIDRDALIDEFDQALIYSTARGYLFDRGAVSACTAHEHLL